MERFSIDVADDVLVDLHRRLKHTRWVDDFSNSDWRYGSERGYLQKLLAYWRDEYDWRQHERAMNRYDHFRTEIDGVPIHFIHARGKGPSPMPLILNHGWPWTFWDMQKIIGPLSDPAAHGGDPADAFDIVVPSLPGYGFSTPLKKTGINFWRTADLWTTLMERLGYGRFATQGADWGAFISAQLGHKYADRIIGLHVQFMAPLGLLGGEGVDLSLYDTDEQHLLDKNMNFHTEEMGYATLQMTKPQTPAYAMNDSPAGLAAWIVEKRRRWSDCGGDVESVFSKDDLITTLMIYWVTQSFGSAARYYYEALHLPWEPSHGRQPVVEAPTGVLLFPKEVIQFPRRWIKEYYNVQQLTEHPSGGHFGAMEQPEVLVKDIRKFFRPLR